VFITRNSTIPRQSGPEKRSHPVTDRLTGKCS